jgi:glycine dehydrogenase
MNAPLRHNDEPATTFVRRHIGPSPRDVAAMLETVGALSLGALMAETLPASIRQQAPLDLGPPLSETEAMAHMRELAAKNRVFTSLIGQGYSGTILPPVIQRNILENPAWYTAYTPYQPEISQGRLEALFNFQTMIRDLTGLDVANASLLDEATAAAEAMALTERASSAKTRSFFVDAEVHPQTLAVLRTRAEPLGLNLIVGDPLADLAHVEVFGG